MTLWGQIQGDVANLLTNVFTDSIEREVFGSSRTVVVTFDVEMCTISGDLDRGLKFWEDEAMLLAAVQHFAPESKSFLWLVRAPFRFVAVPGSV